MNKITTFLLRLIGQILKGISPELRDGLEDAIHALEVKASKTPNVFDDMLVSLIKSLLDV